MGATYRQQIINFFNTTASTSQTVTVGALGTISVAGNAYVGIVKTSSGYILNSVTDSVGNTWYVDFSPSTSGSAKVWSISAYVSNPLANTNTITFNFSAATNLGAIIMEFSGISSGYSGYASSGQRTTQFFGAYESLSTAAATTNTITYPSSGYLGAIGAGDLIWSGQVISGTGTGITWSTSPVNTGSLSGFPWLGLLPGNGTVASSATTNALIGVYGGAITAPYIPPTFKYTWSPSQANNDGFIGFYAGSWNNYSYSISSSAFIKPTYYSTLSMMGIG